MKLIEKLISFISKWDVHLSSFSLYSVFHKIFSIPKKKFNKIPSTLTNKFINKFDILNLTNDVDEITSNNLFI